MENKRILFRILMVWWICMGSIQVVNAQSAQNVTGRVVDESGEAIIGASVVASGQSSGTVTDVDGRFSLTVAPKTTLTISYLGYLNKKVGIGESNHYEITLQEDVQKLDEVVVVAYGTQKKGSITGSVVAINNKELSITKNQNAQNMLTGKVPGVRVIQKTSEPGEFNNQFDIRGFGSPLIVIDGVPRGQDAFARLSPDEIENISVLKDASAAVYGVRAANGVVLITTKKGEKGKSKINYSMFYGIQTPADLLKPVGAVDRMILFNTVSMRNLRSPQITYTDEMIEEYRNGTKQSTDWYDAVLSNTAAQQQHDINFSGGSEKVDYFVNFGYSGQDGFYRSGDLNYERYNLRSNINAQITKRLKVSLNINGIMDNKTRPLLSSWEVYGNLWRMLPSDLIYANNNPDYLLKTVGVPNVLGSTQADRSGFVKNNRKMFQSNASFTYDVPYLTGLSLKGLYSYDMTLTDNTTFRKEYNEYVYDAATEVYTGTKTNAPSDLERSYGLGQTHLWQLSLNYEHTFAEKHNVGALLLYEENHNTGDNLRAYRQLSIPIPYLFAGNADKTQVGTSNANGITDYVSKGIVGRLNYDFAGKYLAEFSFRRDGSSQFAPNEGRWGFFPGGSVGWRLSEENFIKNNFVFINNLKLRASYGVLGDDTSMSYQWVTGYDYPVSVSNNKFGNQGSPAGYIFDDTMINALGFRVMENLGITWYTSETANIGIDSDLWGGLFGFSADVFQRNRTGLLATRNVSVPGTFGTKMPQQNLNSDRTKGFEVELKHRNKIDQVSYGITANLAMTRTMNVYLERTPSGNSYENWRAINNANRYNDVWFGLGANGQYQSYEQIANSPINTGIETLPGDYIYDDWNGDGVIDNYDYHPIGTISNAAASELRDRRNYPLMNFGTTLTASYANFDFSALFQGSAMSNVAYGDQLASPLSWDGNAVAMLLDRWHPVDPKKDPYDPSNQWVSGRYAYGKGSVNTNSEFGIQNGAYLRLKTVELGYTLPKNLVKKVGINNVRLYINAYNLFTITGVKGIDPERPTELYGQMYPLNRTVNFGFNVEL